MKVGSLVECIDNRHFPDYIKLETPYTVREILSVGGIVNTTTGPYLIVGEICLRLEEKSFNHKMYDYLFIDIPFPICYFRELMPNFDIEEMIEKIEIATLFI